MTGLTQKQADMLGAIQRLTTPDGVAPSFDELRGALGLSSKGEVHRILHALKERGCVSFQPGRARSVRIAAVGDGLDSLPDTQLEFVMARAAGIIASRRGDKRAFALCCRIAGSLGYPNGGTA